MSTEIPVAPVAPGSLNFTSLLGSNYCIVSFNLFCVFYFAFLRFISSFYVLFPAFFVFYVVFLRFISYSLNFTSLLRSNYCIVLFHLFCVLFHLFTFYFMYFLSFCILICLSHYNLSFLFFVFLRLNLSFPL